MPANSTSALIVAQNYSHYLFRLLQSEKITADEINQYIERPFTVSDFQQYFNWDDCEDETILKHELRILRQRVFSHLIIRDLASTADLAEVMHTISQFADFAINTALNFAHKQLIHQYGTPIGKYSEQEQSLTVIAMGKLGGFELNVSSDIDLIFTYPEAGDTNGVKSISNQEFFTKVGRKLIALLDDVTVDGQVFRVDMRLRPDGDSGPLVLSEAALEHYLVTQGREWERYAWIKARVVSAGENQITSLIRPFVYRKYLDFDAFDAMRKLHAQIRQEVAQKGKEGNIKLGIGGIREAEFVAQIFQLIRGGKNRSLQLKGTQETLEELVTQNLMTREQEQALLGAYQFLRNLEHRLQYLDDQQTQTLPKDAETLLKVAKSMGFEDTESLSAALSFQQNIVKQAFDQVFQTSDHPKQEEPKAFYLDHLWQADGDKDQNARTLEELNFDAAQTQLRLDTLRQSSKYTHLSRRTQTRFDVLVPLFIEAASKTDHPDLCLSRLLDLLETISRRSAYLALLHERPEALQPLAKIMAASSWVSSYLIRHPILLDELLDARLITQKFDWNVLQNELEQALNGCQDDVEAKMDVLRHFQHAQIFRLATQDLADMWQIESLSDQLTLLADTLLNATLKNVWLTLNKKHTETPHFAIIGYGKLGGKELGYASDLDIVFLYDDAHPEAVETYIRLARRISTWLTSVTSSGSLYEVDLRLRPNGDSGLLVSSFDSFMQYQEEKAWTWEHQALTRARFICGDEKLGEKFEQLRCQILTKARDHEILKQEIIEMREKMFPTHPPKIEDVKYARGGVVDVEFMVQYLILAYAEAHPHLLQNYGNIALLAMAADVDLIDTEKATATRTAYRHFRRIQHTKNLRDLPLTKPDESLLAHYQIAKSLWQDIFNQEI